MGSLENGRVSAFTTAGAHGDTELCEALWLKLLETDAPIGYVKDCKRLNLFVTVFYKPTVNGGLEHKPSSRIKNGNVSDGKAAEPIAVNAVCSRNGLERKYKDSTSRLAKVVFEFGKREDGRVVIIGIVDAEMADVTRMHTAEELLGQQLKPAAA